MKETILNVLTVQCGIDLLNRICVSPDLSIKVFPHPEELDDNQRNRQDTTDSFYTGTLFTKMKKITYRGMVEFGRTETTDGP